MNNVMACVPTSLDPRTNQIGTWICADIEIFLALWFCSSAALLASTYLLYKFSKRLS